MIWVIFALFGRTACMALAAIAVLLVAACGNGGKGPTAPTPFVSTSPWDTSVIYLVDGADIPGPVTVQLESLTEPPGREVLAAPLMVGFQSKFCMDAPNPTNSPFLSRMQIRVYTSVDGRTPGGGSAYSVEGPNHFEVANKSCATIKRMPVEQGGTPGAQFVFFWPGATYLLFAVKYGPWTNELFFPWSAERCPSFEEIARATSPPGCVLRKAYFLDYRWLIQS